MRWDLKTSISESMICQTIKYPTTKSAGLLQPLPVPDHVYEDLTMDFIIGLSLSQESFVIMVVIDRLIIFVHSGASPNN